MFDKEEYTKIVNIPLTVIVASFIIIIVTTNMTDKNGLSALIGGYAGLLVGLLFIVILNWPPSNLLDMFPFLLIMTIVGLLLYYLSIYFDKISSGEVSTYYTSFSILSTIFLAIQVTMIVRSILNNMTSNMFSETTFALLGLFGVINILIVLTIGIVLHFYSTQG